VSTDGALPNEMNDDALFTNALRAAVPSRPDAGLATTLVPRLAAIAADSTTEAETVVVQRAARVRRPAMRRRSRFALAAQVGIAVALIPLVLAGLAVAGVTVPGPARDAFDSVGINLPNQPSDHTRKPATSKDSNTTTGAGGSDVSNAAQTKAGGEGGNSSAAHEHARKQREKARGKAKGHDRGKAVGLNESTPPGQSGQTGPPAHSNAGGSAGSHSSGKPGTPPGPSPNGVAKGHTKIPPGELK
jgi:hypothetical protein